MTTTQITFTDTADIDAEIARLKDLIETHQGKPKWGLALTLATSRIDSLRIGRAGCSPERPLTIELTTL